MDLQNKNLESILKKAENDPELMEIVKGIVYFCQAASLKDIPLEEVAAVGTVGWTIGKDPKLQQLLEHMIKIGQLGIGPEH